MREPRWAPAARRLLGIVLAWLTLTALREPALPLVAQIVIGGVFVAALWNPVEGLLLAAGLAPLGALIGAMFELETFRLTEAIVIAFFSGSMLRGWPVSSGGSYAESSPRPAARWRMVGAPRYATSAAWVLAAMAVASVAGLARHLSWVPGDLAAAARPLLQSYYTALDRFGVIEAAKLFEGLGLVAATIVFFRRRPDLAVQLPAVFGASAFCAAGASVLVWRGLGPVSLLRQQARIGYRVFAHVGDVNAAASYFALVLCLALGMTARERGTGRALWLATAAACAIGLWLSDSRIALASVGIVLGLATTWVVTARWRPMLRAPALIALLVALVALGALRVRSLQRDPDFRSSAFRIQFVETSLRIIKAHPLFGIGVGRYYADSHLFLGPRLAWTYGSENAHNNFLQIASELGLVGLGLFTVWLGGGMAVACRALVRTPLDWRLLGALAGIVALLGTCVTGHPLLIFEVALPFWLQFGLVVALGSSTLLNHAPRSTLDGPPSTSSIRRSPPIVFRSSLHVASAVGVVALMALSVSARRQPIAPAGSPALDGFYEWETGTDSVRFRWSREYASVFLTGDVARVEIPVRVPGEALRRASMGIDVSIDGAAHGRFLVHDYWSMIALDLPRTTPPNDVNRVNLKMDRAWQPALMIPGSADMRSVGVQVGEYRVVLTRGGFNLRRRQAAPR